MDKLGSGLRPAHKGPPNFRSISKKGSAAGPKDFGEAHYRESLIPVLKGFIENHCCLTVFQVESTHCQAKNKKWPVNKN